MALVAAQWPVAAAPGAGWTAKVAGLQAFSSGEARGLVVTTGASGPPDALQLLAAAADVGGARGGARGAGLPPELEALLAEAHEAYRAGDYARALALCQPAHAAAPARVDVLLLLGATHYQLRGYEACAAFNGTAILLDPGLAEAHANLANALQQLGDMDGAIGYYQAALRLKPHFTDALNNMASALVAKGLVPAAMEAYAAALRINPGLADVYNNLGDLWRAQGAPGRAPARACYAAALALEPGYAPGWRGLGDLAREGGDAGGALGAYLEAARLRPSYVDALTGAGAALKELRRAPEAEAAFEAVVALRPGCALSLGNLAGIYYEQGKLEAAVGAYRAALALEPHFPEAHNNLGNALREAGRPEEAAGAYIACIQQQQAAAAAAAAAAGVAGGAGIGAASALLAPLAAQRLSVAYSNLGGLLKMTGQAAAAVACYEQVSLLQPESPEAAANLGSAYKDAARHDAAVGAYRAALALRPDFPEAFANLVHSLQCVCEWRERAPLFARLEAEARRDLAAGRLPAVQPFHAVAYPFAPDLALALSRAYAEQAALAAARLGLPPLAHPPPRRLARGERLRVAYVSSDFGNHPLSHLMGSVFGRHDRSRVEVFCYALSPPDGSEWRARIEAEAEHFLDVSGWPAGDVAGRMAADGVHVALNLNGYTKGARNEAFALRPAPVQASYMGFPATTGAPFLPWLITDATVAPPELRHCYSESLALMPHCYFVNDYARAHRDVLDKCKLPTRAEAGLPEDKVVFSCSNQLYKYDPETFATWCAVLRRVPDSVLWLLRFPPAGEANLRAAAAAAGVDPARVVFTDVAPKAAHIARSGLADVFLDTPLCNAHTTGCDVLWGGCPLVTLPLERMASRVAASLAAATGLGPEMVVASRAEYEERAVALGLDGPRRRGLRARLEAARLSCPLFDTARWVRDLERLLLGMWEIHCSGRGPRTFEIGDAD